jgi:hypothetical protein
LERRALVDDIRTRARDEPILKLAACETRLLILLKIDLLQDVASRSTPQRNVSYVQYCSRTPRPDILEADFRTVTSYSAVPSQDLDFMSFLTFARCQVPPAR